MDNAQLDVVLRRTAQMVDAFARAQEELMSAWRADFTDAERLTYQKLYAILRSDDLFSCKMTFPTLEKKEFPKMTNENNNKALIDADNVDILIADGKYRLIKNSKEFKVLRHGQEWRDLTGDNFVASLLYWIETRTAQPLPDQGIKKITRANVEEWIASNVGGINEDEIADAIRDFARVYGAGHASENMINALEMAKAHAAKHNDLFLINATRTALEELEEG